MSHLTKIYNRRCLQIFEEYKADGIPNRDICKKVGMAQVNISRVRKGERSFTTDQIIRISKVSGINIDWVMGMGKRVVLKPKSI